MGGRGSTSSSMPDVVRKYLEIGPKGIDHKTMNEVGAAHRLGWDVLSEEGVDPKTARLIAANLAEYIYKNFDDGYRTYNREKELQLIKVTKDYALGKATSEDMNKAREAAQAGLPPGIGGFTPADIAAAPDTGVTPGRTVRSREHPGQRIQLPPVRWENPGRSYSAARELFDKIPRINSYLHTGEEARHRIMQDTLRERYKRKKKR